MFTMLKMAGEHLRSRLVAGTVVVIPLAATLLILSVVFFFVDDKLQVIYVNRFYHVPFWESRDQIPRGVGFATMLVTVYLVGLVASHVLGRRLVELGHRVMGVIPIVRAIYHTAKELTDFLSVSNSPYRHSRVVVLDYPRAGVKSIGLVTHRIKGHNGAPLMLVYIPSTPNPTTGFLVIAPEEELTPVEIPVEEVMRIVITGGILSPESLGVDLSKMYDRKGRRGDASP